MRPSRSGLHFPWTRRQLQQVVLAADTPGGKLYNVVIFGAILLSVVVLLLEPEPRLEPQARQPVHQRGAAEPERQPAQRRLRWRRLRPAVWEAVEHAGKSVRKQRVGRLGASAVTTAARSAGALQPLP